jgi:hypothetical protein
MRLFERGQLGELKACLPTLIDCAVASRRFDALADPECVALAQENIEARLALWWTLNYDALIGDLRASGVDYRVVLHEELSTRPGETVAELFSFCGMEMEPQVDAYLTASTSQAPPSDSAVDTFRVSDAFARTTIAKLDEALCCTIDAVLARVAKAQHLESGIGPHLERYLDGEGKLLREWP